MYLKLVRPTQEYAWQVMYFKNEVSCSDDENKFAGCVGLGEVDSFSEWMDFRNRLMTKYGKDYVPSDVFLGVRIHDDKLVGIIDYRQRLSSFLMKYGGHVGFSILPSVRGKGYGSEMLKLLLPYCKERGEKRILITCDKTNEASRRVILRNGGELENEIIDDVGLGACGIIQRYWITL